MFSISYQSYLTLLNETNIKPNVHTLTNITNACIRIGEINKALNIINDLIKQYNIIPNDICYNILIKGYLDNNQYQQALYIFNHSIQDYTERIYTTMLKGCMIYNQAKDAETIIQHMLHHNLSITSTQYEYLAIIYGQSGHINLLLELLELGSHNFTIKTYCISTIILAIWGYIKVAKSYLKITELKLTQKNKEEGKKPDLFMKINHYEIEKDLTTIKEYINLYKRRQKQQQLEQMVSIDQCKTIYYLNKAAYVAQQEKLQYEQEASKEEAQEEVQEEEVKRRSPRRSSKEESEKKPKGVRSSRRRSQRSQGGEKEEEEEEEEEATAFNEFNRINQDLHDLKKYKKN